MDVDNIDVFFSDLGKKVQEFINSLKTQIASLNNEVNVVSDLNYILQNSLDNSKNQVAILNAENATLKKRIEIVEEEKLQFSRVSQIVAMEKENARLRNEIDLLQSKLTKIQSTEIRHPKRNDPIPMVVEEEQAPEENKPDKDIVSEPTEKDIMLTGSTKKINGKSYYVYNNLIYEKTETGAGVAPLGRIYKHGNKSKVEWYL